MNQLVSREEAMKAAIFIPICVLVAGCAGQQTTLAPESLRALASQPVYAVHYEPHEGFMIESSGYTTAAVLFSPLVVIAAAAEGRELRSQLALEDPAARAKERLLKTLQSGLRLDTVRSIAQWQKSDPTESLKKAHGTGVMLDVRTTKWGIDNNRAKYQARARLVRLSDAEVLWEATCNETVADRGRPSPTREAISADNGALLKAKLGEAADACADQLAAWAVGR
jgi:hypothetical protein